MNPGLVVKLRPTGPWRIGPDSGARNRVDAIYHSDSLYSAVTSAMARLGSLDEWLEATARAAVPAVCFSSCFPFMDDVGYIVPPRTAWPPVKPGVSTRVRWKSARFVPLELVRSVLARKRLDDSRWTVDGPSQCLAPAGSPGPFRTAVRWNAAVDRLTGVAERHSTACIEFRPGAGLWTIVSFTNEAARDRWQEPVKAAFCLLADSGFGGERSRGWGRAEQPEFIEGVLPGLVLGEQAARAKGADEGPAPEPQAPGPQAMEAAVRAPEETAALEAGTQGGSEFEAMEEVPEAATVAVPSQEPEPPADAAQLTAEPETAPAGSAQESETPVDEPQQFAEPEPEPPAHSPETPAPPVPPEEPESAADEAQRPVEPEAPALSPGTPALVTPPQEPELPVEAQPAAPEAPAPVPQAPAPGVAYWMLSVFAPAATDGIDWSRGNYTLMTRGGRVESPAGSGELKKQVHMLAEGSVVYAAEAPRGSAPDVAPDGFAHPVYRAGFAVSIPLPEVG